MEVNIGIIFCAWALHLNNRQTTAVLYNYIALDERESLFAFFLMLVCYNIKIN